MDPSLFFDDDGKVYYTRHGGGRNGGVYQVGDRHRDRQARRGAAPRLVAAPAASGPRGRTSTRSDGTYYLLISEGGTSYGHMLTVARSKSPWGPFEANPANPILTHRNVARAAAAGRGTWRPGADARAGDWWMVLLGIRPIARHHHIGRETLLAPVTWDANGWPVVNGGAAARALDERATGLAAAGAVAARAGARRVRRAAARPCSGCSCARSAKRTVVAHGAAGRAAPEGLARTLDDVATPAFVARRQEHFRVRARPSSNSCPRPRAQHGGARAAPERGQPLRAARHRRAPAPRRARDARRGRDARSCARRRSAPGPVTLQVEAFPDRYDFAVRVGDGAAHAAGLRADAAALDRRRRAASPASSSACTRAARSRCRRPISHGSTMSRWRLGALARPASSRSRARRAHALGEKAFVEYAPPPARSRSSRDGARRDDRTSTPASIAGVMRAAARPAGRHRARDRQAARLLRDAKALRAARDHDRHARQERASSTRWWQPGQLDVSAIRGKWEGFAHPGRRASAAGRRARAGDRRQRQARHDLRHLRALRADRRLALVLVGRRAGRAAQDASSCRAGTRVADAPVVQYRGIFLNDEAPALTGWAKREVRRLQPRVLREGLRADPAAARQLPLARDVGPAPSTTTIPQNGQARRRVRHRDGHLAPRADDARAARVAPRRRQGAVELRRRTPSALREFWRGGVAQHARLREDHHARHARRRRRADVRARPTWRCSSASSPTSARIIAEELDPDVDRSAAGLGALQGSAGVLRARHARARRRDCCSGATTTGATSAACRRPRSASAPGGAGIYYHFDYVGGPRNYKWINVTPLPKVWEQMHLAWQVRRRRACGS